MKKVKSKPSLLKAKRLKLKTSQKDSYATQGMLLAVRDELKSDIVSLDLKIEARMKGFDSKLMGFEGRMLGFESKLTGFESKLTSFESKLTSFESKLNSFESKMTSFDAKMSRMLGLMEEQRAENRTVWDQQNAIIYRQEKLEDRLSIVEDKTSLIQVKGK